jgi:PEGA domain
MLKNYFAIIMLCFFTCACAANQAAFISEPAGAQVYVNGELIGTTPCELNYRCNSGDDYEILIQKEGFEPVSQTFKADEVNQGARKTWMTAGLVWSPLWIGTLFTKKLKDSYEIVMKEEALQLTARNSQPAEPQL